MNRSKSMYSAKLAYNIKQKAEPFGYFAVRKKFPCIFLIWRFILWLYIQLDIEGHIFSSKVEKISNQLNT